MSASTQRSLEGRVAAVAGASRGAGRGIARALGAAGAKVYVMGRTSRSGAAPPDGAPGTVEETAEDVDRNGGRGIPVVVDLTRRPDVEAVFDRIEHEAGGLDVLANAVWGGSEIIASLDWRKPFWRQPLDGWDAMMLAGPYAYLLASVYAARLMARSGGGLIAHVTDAIDEDGTHYRGNIYWDLGHETINRMVLGMSQEGRKDRIAVVAVNPGFMRTERVLMHLKTEAQKKTFGFSRSESPEYVGRAVAALAADPDRLAKSGRLLWAADLAEEYGFTDIDGKRVPRFDPRPDE